MEQSKRDRLEATGWAAGSAAEFLGLSDVEARLVELRVSLSRSLHDRRTSQGLTQTELAGRLGSSQSRVAKMEAADRSVSLDLLVRGLLATGATAEDIAAAIAPSDRNRAA